MLKTLLVSALLAGALLAPVTAARADPRPPAAVWCGAPLAKNGVVPGGISATYVGCPTAHFWFEKFVLADCRTQSMCNLHHAGVWYTCYLTRYKDLAYPYYEKCNGGGGHFTFDWKHAA